MEATTAADLRTAANKSLENWAAQVTLELVEIRERLTRDMARGYALSDALVANLVTAEEHNRILAAVFDRVEYDEVDRVAATAAVAELEQERLLRGGFSSRSTSTVCNALEDVRRETVSRWLNHMLVVWAVNNA